MAHLQQRDYLEKIRNLFPDKFTGVNVIEIGSLDINGTVRDFFHADRYVGVDVGPGRGVDVVALGQDVDYPDNTFDVAISAECFEHNPAWVETFANMIRMSKDFIIMTCASEGRPEHGTTRTSPGSSPLTLDWDYYRNLTEADFREHFDFDTLFTEYEFEYNPVSHDLYFWGVKRDS